MSILLPHQRTRRRPPPERQREEEDALCGIWESEEFHPHPVAPPSVSVTVTPCVLMCLIPWGRLLSLESQ